MAAEVLNQPAQQTSQEEPEKELRVIVTCRDHEEQQALMERLKGEGYACKASRRTPRQK
jgi:hypothetical protein